MLKNIINTFWGAKNSGVYSILWCVLLIPRRSKIYKTPPIWRFLVPCAHQPQHQQQQWQQQQQRQQQQQHQQQQEPLGHCIAVVPSPTSKLFPTKSWHRPNLEASRRNGMRKQPSLRAYNKVLNGYWTGIERTTSQKNKPVLMQHWSSLALFEPKSLNCAQQCLSIKNSILDLISLLRISAAIWVLELRPGRGSYKRGYVSEWWVLTLALSP